MTSKGFVASIMYMKQNKWSKKVNAMEVSLKPMLDAVAAATSICT